MIYQDYMKSDAWKKRKQFYFETHQRICRACKSSKRIHLHHKTYRRLGNERDADLVPLCHICHSELHKIQRNTGQNLWLATEDFIRNRNKKYVKKRKQRKITKRKSRLLKKNTKS